MGLIRYRKAVVGLMLLTLFASSSETVYYVNAMDGDEANPGTSVHAAWKSLAKVNDRVFIPGDSILFRLNRRYNGKISFRQQKTADRVHEIRGMGKKEAWDALG